MPELALLRRCAVAASILVLSTAPLTAQPSNETRVLNAVMRHRAYVTGDSTRFDACSVYNALGRPTNFPAGIDPGLAPLLDRTKDPCTRKSSSVTVRCPPYMVRVDSLMTGRAVLRIVKGEYSFREAYTLRHEEVREVRTFGITQSYLVPPRRRGLPPNLSP